MAERGENNHFNGSIESGTVRKNPIPPGWRIAIVAAIVFASVVAAYLMLFNNPSSKSSDSRLDPQNAEISETSGNLNEGQVGATADPQPADFKIDGSVLIITNKGGRELFRFDTGLDDLVDEVVYRRYFPTKSRSVENALEEGRTQSGDTSFPYLFIKDLENDGKNEVLFSPNTKSGSGVEKIYCFSAEGEKLWEYKTGSRQKYGQIVYPDQYNADEIWVEDIDNDGKAEIFVVADHRDDFPTQFLVLGADGKKRGEYWNAGRLMDYTFYDINGDGIKEILIAGMNNEHEAPALVIFDQKQVEGGSPQSTDFF